ncbi:hypothetical protein MTO96_001439 [Rhipicephalus appendiculatus]
MNRLDVEPLRIPTRWKVAQDEKQFATPEIALNVVEMNAIEQRGFDKGASEEEVQLTGERISPHPPLLVSGDHTHA